MPIVRAGTDNPCSACTDMRKSRAMSRASAIPALPSNAADAAIGPPTRRLLAHILGSSVHGPASLPKRRAVPTPATPETPQHPHTSEVCFWKFSLPAPRARRTPHALHPPPGRHSPPPSRSTRAGPGTAQALYRTRRQPTLNPQLPGLLQAAGARATRFGRSGTTSASSPPCGRPPDRSWSGRSATRWESTSERAVRWNPCAGSWSHSSMRLAAQTARLPVHPATAPCPPRPKWRETGVTGAPKQALGLCDENQKRHAEDSCPIAFQCRLPLSTRTVTHLADLMGRL
ncbi:hypothetical protein SUDANB135_00144 [Streptomyces sp. SudanB135_2055]